LKSLCRYCCDICGCIGLEGEGVEVVLVFVFDDMIDCDCSLLFAVRKGEDVDVIVNGDRDVSEGASVFEN
jgi:hypothetical protein